MYVEARGSISQIAKLFAVTQNQYQFHGMQLQANSEPPSIPASLAPVVSFIEGLHDSDVLISIPGSFAYECAAGRVTPDDCCQPPIVLRAAFPLFRERVPR